MRRVVLVVLAPSLPAATACNSKQPPSPPAAAPSAPAASAGPSQPSPAATALARAGQPAERADSSANQPAPGDAKQVLRKLSDFYRQAKTFQVNYVQKVSVDFNGMKNTMDSTAKIAVERPNRLALRQTALWALEQGTGIDDVWAADLDGDGKDEVIVGYNGGTGLHVFGGDGQRRWQKPLGNVWHVTAGDLDGDGTPEARRGGSPPAQHGRLLLARRGAIRDDCAFGGRRATPEGSSKHRSY